MSLRGRRVLHFSSLLALLLGLLCGAGTLGLTSSIGEDGLLLRTEGLLASLYLLALGLLLKLRGLMEELPEPVSPGTTDPVPHELLAVEIQRPAALERGFRWAGTLLSATSFLLFLGLVAIRSRMVPTLSGGDSSASAVSIPGLVLAIALQLTSLHLLLTAMGKLLRRVPSGGHAGLMTRLSGAPSLPPGEE